MECLENCNVLKNCRTDKDRIRLACVPLKNEAYIVDINDQVFHIVNDRIFSLYILCGKKVEKFVYSFYINHGLFGQFSYHMMALTEDGRIYGWGGNFCDQIIRNMSLEIPESIRLKHMSSNRNPFHRIEAQLSDIFYELSETFNCCSPTLVNFGQMLEPYIKYKKVRCGAAHCIALTNNNEVVVWGNNKFGQLGIGSISQSGSAIKFKVCSKPAKEHESVNPCRMLCCVCVTGLSFLTTLPLALLMHMGCLSLTSCLSCSFGICCCRKFGQKQYEFIIRGDDEIDEVGCGATHNLVLFKDGKLCGWGNNLKGQLGRVSNVTILHPCPIFDQVKKFVAFNDNTLVLQKDGTLYTMGDNSYGQLGYYDSKDSKDPKDSKYSRNPKEPFQIKGIQFKDITAIGQFCLGQTIDDKYYAWGLYKSEILQEIVKIKVKNDSQIGADRQTSENNIIELNEIQPILPEVGQQNVEQPQQSYIACKRVKAHILVKPTLVTCNSFDDFISYHFGLTNYTATIQLDRTANRNTAAKHNPIDEKDLRVIEYNVRLDNPSQQNNSFTNFNVDQSQTYSPFGNSQLYAGHDFNINDNDFCSKKVENTFNSKMAGFFGYGQ